MRRNARVLIAVALPGLVLTGYLTLAHPATAAPPATPYGTPGPYAMIPGLLAFQREAVAGDHTQVDVYSVKPNGGGLRALTATPDNNEFGPVWNRAGTRIAFWRTPAPFGPGTVWTMDPNGGNQQQLTSGVDARDPAWSPDGQRIVFTLVDATGSHLWTMRAADGGDRQQVTSGPDMDFEPAWSPDGTRIAYTHGISDGDVGDICVRVLATSTTTCVTNSPDYDHQVAWSPNSARLVFERDFTSTNSASIFTVGANGSGLTALTTGAAFDTGPTYSPDGLFIAFGSDRASFLHDLWIMRSDGRRPRRIVSSPPTAEGFPDWRR